MEWHRQQKNVETRDYYRYAWLWVRIATKADGKTCYVILESSGLGHIQPPAVMKSRMGKVSSLRIR